MGGAGSGRKPEPVKELPSLGDLANFTNSNHRYHYCNGEGKNPCKHYLGCLDNHVVMERKDNSPFSRYESSNGTCHDPRPACSLSACRSAINCDSPLPNQSFHGPRIPKY